MRDLEGAAPYGVEEYVTSGLGGWEWRLVTCRDTYEDAVSTAGSWSSNREARGTVPSGMRVLNPDGLPVWDDIDTLEERRLRLDERRKKA